MSVPTVDDLKVETNIPTTADDEELQTKLDQAIALVEGLIGPVGDPTPVTETHYGVNSPMLVLKQMPVGELTAISPRPYPGVTTVPFDVADYVLDPATGIVRAGNGGWFYGDYTVTYTTGYEDIPADVSGAIVLIAAHLWQTQLGATPTALALQNPDFADTDPGSLGAGYAIPNRAKDLLARYMRPSIA